MRYDNPGLENIITGDRSSYLVQVCGEDPAFVVGYFCDIRGLRVCTDEVRFRKVTGKPEGSHEIALRIRIGDEVEPVHPSQLTFDHSTRDYAGI